LLVTLLSGCAAGLNAFTAAEKLESEGKYDEAVLGYAEAISDNPEASEYRLRFLKASEKGAELHLAKGQVYLEKNNLDESLREFQAAIALDPAMERAKQLAAKVQRMRDALMFRLEGEAFEREHKLKEALRSYQRSASIYPDDTEAKAAVQRLLGARKTRLDGYDLSLKSQQPITLKFKEAKMKDVFAIITQLSGINFIFDEGVKEQNVTIHLEKATFNQAVEVVTGMFKLGRKVLNDSTVILYPKTPDKQKNYEELVVKTFYLNSLDAKKAVNLLRTMLQLKKIYVNEESNALVIRDTPETIAVAERILDANDVPAAEVLLEVEIIELSKKNQEKFGLALSRYAISAVFDHNNSFLLDSLSGTVTTGDNTGTVVAPPKNLLPFDLGSFHGFHTVPNATFNFGKALANGETLSNPKLRVKNREKAKFNVGTRVPITTTSTTGSTSGYSVNVQYVDVGVKMNAEPTIQLNNQITLKVGLEVSSIINKEKVGTEGATTVVTIGTRNLDTVLDLKDGETTIIGGLIQDTKSKSKNKIMFLSDIPVIGALLTDRDDSTDKTELILAITPRLIKGVTIPDEESTQFWSGRDDEPSTASPYVSFTEEPEFAAPATKEKDGKPVPVAPVSPKIPEVKAPAASPAAAAGVAAPAAAPAPEVPTFATVAPEAASGPAEFLWSLPEGVTKGADFTIGIAVDNASNMHSAPLVIAYDTSTAEFVSAQSGPFLSQDGQPVSFQANADPAGGTVTITMSRPAGAAGVNGLGELVTLTFRSLASGVSSQFSLRGVAVKDPSGKPLQVTAGDAFVEMQ
jgi:general secretion pathway protein D